MNIIDDPGIDPKIKAELQEACDRFAQGIRDPEAARKSRERMAKSREALRHRIGIQNVVVDLVRHVREGS